MIRPAATATIARARLEAVIAFDRFEHRDLRPPTGPHARFGAAAGLRAALAREADKPVPRASALRPPNTLSSRRPVMLTSRACDICILTPNRTTPAKDVEPRVSFCRAGNRHHTCIRTPHGQIIHCRPMHDLLGGSAEYWFARAMGHQVLEIDPDTLTNRPRSHDPCD